MFDLGSAVGYLLLNTSGFDSGLERARRALNTLTDSTSTAADKFKAVGSVLNDVGGAMTTGLTLPIVGAGAAMIKTAADFEQGMSKVKSVMFASSKDIDADMELLTERAQEMGATTAFSANEASEAMYYMGLAGWDAQQVYAGIPGVMNLAAASGESLASVSDIVTDALSAMKLTAEDTSHFVDVLAKTTASSNTDVAMLGESFKYVAPVAGALGFNIEDLSLALGLMANNGIKASSSGTALRTLLTNMARPTKNMQKAIDRLGVSLSDENGKMYSLKEILDQLREAFNGTAFQQDIFVKKSKEIQAQLESGLITQEQYDQAIAQLTQDTDLLTQSEMAKYAAMLAGKEGMSGLLAIVNTSEKDYNKLAEAIATADGTAQEMADIQLDNLAGQLTLLKSAVEGMAIAFGNLLLPQIKSAVVVVQGIVDWINNLDESQKKIIVTVLEVVAAIGPLLLIVGKISTLIGTLIPMISGGAGISAALTLLTGPIGIVIAAVAALAAAWATDFGGIREKTFEILGAIQEIIVNVWTFISTAWNENLLGIRTYTEDALQLLEATFEFALTWIKDTFDIFAALFSGDWEGVWNGVKQLFSDTWQGIQEVLGAALNLIIDTILNIGVSIYNAASSAWENFKLAVQNKWNAFKVWFASAKEDPVKAITELGPKLYAAGAQIFTSLWNGIKSVWEGIANWVEEKVQWLLDKISSVTGSSTSTDRPPSITTGYGGGFASGLDYVPRDMNVTVHRGEAILTAQENENRYNSGGGDTYNFYSPEALTPTKAAREFKRVKQELALGYR